ncbi:MAG: hypothetical protein B7X12_06450 [Halothiobacillus sp. 20-53-49]|nr:MAG: hypothetical protein B7X12_06450 [Halothiobacillus sp. 20-53-49]HUN00987.1 glycosyltransferase family 4 protein [Halothiobacillus sp.]
MPVAIVLPMGEGFSIKNAGAVALTVADQLQGATGKSFQVICGHDSLGLDSSLMPSLSLSIPKFFWPPFGPSRWRDDRGLQSLLKQIQPDLVEVHDKGNMFLRLSHLSYPMAFYLHGDPRSASGTKTLKERIKIAQRSVYVVAPSEFVRSVFCAGLPAELSSKVHVIYNAINVERFNPLNIKKSEIIFVGRLIQAKGVLQLVEALNLVLKTFPAWRARFIGAQHFGQTKPKFPFEFEVLSKVDPDIADRVHFDWFQPYDRVISAFNQAAISVTPSLCEEAFGRTALEGMAAGCAVIASNRGGLPEVIGDAGILIEPAPDTIAQALCQLMASPDACAKVGAHGSERARTIFEPTAIYKKINQLRLDQLVIKHEI